MPDESVMKPGRIRSSAAERRDGALRPAAGRRAAGGELGLHPDSVDDTLPAQQHDARDHAARTTSASVASDADRLADHG